MKWNSHQTDDDNRDFCCSCDIFLNREYQYNINIVYNCMIDIDDVYHKYKTNYGSSYSNYRLSINRLRI